MIGRYSNALEKIEELWTDLRLTWTLIVDKLTDSDADDKTWNALAVSCALFLRNLVAGVPEAQIKAR